MQAETEAMLKAARAQQMEQKEHFLAVQAQRERGDFERVLQAQQELIEKDKVQQYKIHILSHLGIYRTRDKSRTAV